MSMTSEQLEAMYEKHEDEHLKFESIPEAERRHSRSDLCGMILLAERFPVENDRDMVCSASHDQIWFDAGPNDDGNWPLDESDVVYLYRCGIWYDSDTDSLTSFV